MFISAEDIATTEVSWSDEAGTVYGGTLEYLGGDAWRLTKTMQGLSLGDASYSTSGSAFQILKSGLECPALGNMACLLMCDRYAYSDSAVDKKMTQINNYIRFYDSDYSSADGFKTAMASANAQLVYELATPVTYDLTGEELARLVGQNNIFANCGQSTVVITEPTYFVNPGYFTSKPIIRVYGDGTFRVGDNIITIAEHDEPYIDIDSELQDCYCGDTNMNQYVTFTSGEYPVLVPGSNYVLMGEGITKLVITPNWWEL